MAYIKLEDALQVCSEAEEWYTETNEQQCAVVSDDIYQQIANLPTADVVEVVRCKECKHFAEYAEEYKSKVEGADGDCFIRLLNSDNHQFIAVKCDGFCSYGERRTDDGLY